MNPAPDHPDFTAALLGEAGPARSVLIVEEIQRQPLLRREAAEINAAVEMLTSTLRRTGPEYGLTPERRAAILRREPRAGAGEEPLRNVISMPVAPVRTPVAGSWWTRPAALAIGAAAVVTAGFFFLPGVPGAWDWKNQKIPGPVAEEANPDGGLIRVRPGEPRKSVVRNDAAPVIPTIAPQVPRDLLPPVPELPDDAGKSGPLQPESSPGTVVKAPGMREAQPPGPDNPEPTSSDGPQRRRPGRPEQITSPKLQK